MHVVVATTDPTLVEVASKLQAAGHEVSAVDSDEEAVRRVALSDLTAVVIGGGPDAAEPFSRLLARERRRAIVVQVADGVRTADGATAFARGVNLVVARTDARKIVDLLTLAERRHRDLVSLLEPELGPK